MVRLAAATLLIVFMGFPVNAQTFLMRETAGTTILDTATGRKSAVIQAPSGKDKPSNCPPGAFYELPGNVFVRCDDGQRFTIENRPVGAALPPNAVLLRQIPRDGTDDPGPAIKR